MRPTHYNFQRDKIIALLKEKGLTTQEAITILKVEIEYLIYKDKVNIGTFTLEKNGFIDRKCRRQKQSEYYQALKMN